MENSASFADRVALVWSFGVIRDSHDAARHDRIDPWGKVSLGVNTPSYICTGPVQVNALSAHRLLLPFK